MRTEVTLPDLVVLKFGSSLLSGADGFATAAGVAAARAEEGRRVLVVCSARRGVTDALLAAAREVAPAPAPWLLAELLATGEQASVALLALALRARGVEAAALDARALGLRTRGRPLDACPTSVDAGALGRAFTGARVVVVPGFVGVDVQGRSTVLGRGGSDLTALFLGHRLGSRECLLVKDVDGLFPEDPRIAPAGRAFERASWDDVRAFGAGVVQEKALRYARRHRYPFRIVAPYGTGTQVGPGLRAAS